MNRQAVLSRDTHVPYRELSVLTALASHDLRERLDGEPGRVAWHEIGLELRVAGSGDHAEVAGEVGVRYQPFAAVQHNVIAAVVSRRGEVSSGTVRRFRQGEGYRALPRGDAWEQGLALVLVSESAQRVRE